MSAYYNENDPFAAAWLRELIKEKLIADGNVDERSITEVKADDVRGYTQAHWFAGIGGWSYALRLAGWSDDQRVWTGSCPCQPFSSAGAQAGGHDPRDLWPVWCELVRQCRPPVVFGEQVEAAIGHGWLDRLCDDLEAEDYAVGACGLPGPSVGAFDIRARLWFVADTERGATERHRYEMAGAASVTQGAASQRERLRDESRHGGESCDMADTESGNGRLLLQQRRSRQASSESERSGEVGALDHAEQQRAERSASGQGRAERQAPSSGKDEGGRQLQAVHAGVTHELGYAHGARHAIGDRQCRDDAAQAGTATRQALIEAGASFWREAEWIACSDGKARPVEPGTFPLAHGVPARVGRLRGYGNAIKPQVAAAFIEAYCEARGLSAAGVPREAT